ncbi:MAG TPA: class I SAM-dependent methyltransferase, partial [Negativicutes bacterium]|nr:class I SAM-dependent methyltransferase [Negativicutes bacterium]
MPDLTAKEKYIHGVFAAIARRYDLMNTLLSFNRDKYWRQFAVAKTGLAAGGLALDVCCGTGLLALELAKTAGPTGRVVGVDFCRAMLDVAAANIAAAPGGAAIDLLEANAMALPFADDSFD